MSIQELSNKENSSNNEIKDAIKKFLVIHSKNPRDSIKDKAQLNHLIRKWNAEPLNQPEITSLIQYLSSVELQDGQEYLAAKALEQIKFGTESGLEQKDRVVFRICELLITAGDIYSADSWYRQLKFIKNFSQIPGDKSELQFLEMRFKLVDAQFLRHLRRHADAGLIYLSYVGNPRLKDFPEQRESIIGSAIVCVVLASHSAKRASLLANLYSNELAASHPLFRLVERVLMGNILTKEDATSIDGLLSTSEKKLTEDGITPLEGAVFQHNIRCLPKLYGDISFRTLGELLGVDSHNTNFFLQLQKMIFQGFPAQIDQVRELVTFTKSEASQKGYNQRITKYCEALDRYLQKC